MLSRVASSIYWMNRYLERANNVARFIDVNLRLILDMRFTGQQTQWEPLVRTSGDDQDFFKRYDICDEKNVIKFLTFDDKNPNAIVSCIQSARENARTIREMISSELWECINEFYHLVKKNSRKRRLDDLQAFYAKVYDYNNLITGIYEDAISHNEAWHFARLGQMLERADKTARMIDVKYFLLLPNAEVVGSPYDTVEWTAVLKSASAFEMYRKQFQRVNYKDVTGFLIFDRHFPRSIKYCINAAAQSLQCITDFLDIAVSTQAEMTKLQDLLLQAKLESILGNGLHEFIDLFQFNLNVVDQSINQSFFAPKEIIANP